MIFPEIGHFALILAMMFSIALGVVPFIGYYTRNGVLLNSAKPLTYISALLIWSSLIILAVAFATDDFSLLYVSQHSNSLLPVWFKISAVWG
ncbi:hypothetical protein ACFQ25_05045, partial [Latilactobacillus sakei subsp. carnosus]